MTRSISRHAPRRRRGPARQCLLAMLLAFPALAQAAPVYPYGCVELDGPDGFITAWFGYNNPNTEAVTISIGPANFFSPAPNFRGQVTTFLPGFHERAFATYIDPATEFPSEESKVIWHLDGSAVEITLDIENYCYGAVKDLVITPSGTLFAGMEAAGVFRSMDGITWEAVNTGLEGRRVHALVLHPADPSTLFAGTDKGVYKSVNSGDSWQPMNNGLLDIESP